MTDERQMAEKETMDIIKIIRNQPMDEALLRVAAMSYARGIRDGAEIAKKPENGTAA